MAKKKKEEAWCCWGSAKRSFPTFAVVILVLGLLWLLSDLNVITVDVPWFPVVLIIVALGWLADHYMKKK
jgi:hypothetical protein